MKNISTLLSILIFTLFTTFVKAQYNEDATLYIEVLVDSQGRIYAQNDRVQESMLHAWVKNYLNSQPAFLYNDVVYRIYGDKNISSGVISNVVANLLKGYDHQIQVKKYLLDVQELNLDGQNYIQKLNDLDWQQKE